VGEPLVAATAQHIAAWTRERFGLPSTDVVLVNQLASALPGFPPWFTVIIFWSAEMARRHHLKIFKPMAEIAPEDLPPYWMRDALIVPPGTGCDCC
jgi:hypothetical protein